MHTVGIDIGSVSINCVVVDQDGNLVYEAPYQRHFGRILALAFETIQSIYQRVGLNNIQSVAFTGNYAKTIASRLGALYEYESITHVLGVLHQVPDASAIISMGGQDAALYLLSHNDDQWYLQSFAMNGPCAAGTGSFIDQQAERLSPFLHDSKISFSQARLSHILSGFVAQGKQSNSPSPVACRCTVFTKSDMIHLQNKGEPLPNIIAGLHMGTAANYMSTIVCGQNIQDPVVFVGGVAGNELQVRAFRKYFPHILIPSHHTSLGALGAALYAMEQKDQTKPDPAVLETGGEEFASDFPEARPLQLQMTRFIEDAVVTRPKLPSGAKHQVYLGLDIGSTTTKTVLVDSHRNIIHKQYVQTQGKPIEVTRNLLEGIQEEFGRSLEFVGIATTGSGRYLVGEFVAADLIIDEITAHARAAVFWDPEVDTVFEIGGQDSKYIWIENGNPMDFEMNKVCAAGTGSFIHELANKHNIDIVGEFQEIALSSKRPIHLAERCTVFMESDLVSYAQKGALQQDLIAGLCYAVVYNYLNRVVQKRRIGKRIMFLGGPSLNKGIAAAFENVLGQEIIMPEHREVLGAYGAALSIMQKRLQSDSKASTFPGINQLVQTHIGYNEKICCTDKDCHNRCKLKIYDFGYRKSIWGGECGRYEVGNDREPTAENLFAKRELFMLDYLKGRCVDVAEMSNRKFIAGKNVKILDGRPTIGIPRALHMLQYGILWCSFWTQLGFAVVLSPRTDQQISMTGIESMTSETCYPIKVFQGHIKSLMGMTRYLFLPTIINMPTPNPEEIGFFCPLVQGSKYMAAAALNIPDAALVSPIVYLKESVARVVMDLYQSFGKRLNLSHRQIDCAYRGALEIQLDFQQALLAEGRKFLESLKTGETWVAVSGRYYNLYDERVNLSLGRHLAKLGIKALPQDFLDTADVDLGDFPNMYWGMGARILRTAKLVTAKSGAYGIHLTNFFCGTDSFIEHFYRHLMGSKPYLILELDEHSAVAGAVTRLEAYQNVIQNEHDRIN